MRWSGGVESVKSVTSGREQVGIPFIDDNLHIIIEK